MQTPEERSQRHERYVTSAELLGLGWTRHQIKRRLGEPDSVLHVGWADRYLWLRARANATQLPPRCKSHPPMDVDLLAATFAVNRAAKRYRDVAERCYQIKAHNFATVARKKKEALYDLKDRGSRRHAGQGGYHVPATTAGWRSTGAKDTFSTPRSGRLMLLR